MKTILNITYGVLIGLLAGGIIWLTSTRPQGKTITLLPSTTPGLITVYVSGAVTAPGVYTLPHDSRVEAAINASGGFLPGAEREKINQAAILEDGQQIDVPGLVDTSHISAGRINLNSASAEELDALPGIGPTTAQSIIDYRDENGPFEFIQDLLKVPGIGPATFDKIKDLISIEP